MESFHVRVVLDKDDPEKFSENQRKDKPEFSVIFKNVF